MTVEPSLLWILIAVFALLLLTIFAYLVYSGLTAHVQIDTKEPDFDGFVVAYKTGQGPYSTAGDLYTSAFSLLPHRQMVGLYYDDPDDTAPQDLRYAVGSILGSSEFAVLDRYMRNQMRTELERRRCF
mgnify:CR=1 FL=1